MNIRVTTCGLFCFFTACSVPRYTDAISSRDGSSAIELGAPQTYAPDALFMKQHGDFMLRREPWRPEAQVSGLITSDAEVKGEPGNFDMKRAEANIERRIPVDPDRFVDVSIQYDQRHYAFSGNAQTGKGGAPSGADLFRASATIQYGEFLDKDTLLEVDFTPGVWTDFGGTLERQDWRFYGRGLMTWRYSNDLFLVGGAEYSELFRDFYVYPMAGVTWIPDPEWRVDVLLPRQIRLTYLPSAHDSIFFSVDLEGGNYHVRSPVPRSKKRRVSAQELQISLGAQHRFDTHLSAFGRIGTTVGGHYEFQSSGQGNYNGTLEPEAFAEVGVGWSF